MNLIAEIPPPTTGELVFFWDEDTASAGNGFYGHYPIPGYFLSDEGQWTDWFYGTAMDTDEFTHWIPSAERKGFVVKRPDSHGGR